MAFQLKVNKNVRKGQPYVPALVHVSKDSASLPQSAAASIFTVSNGRIQVYLLLGEVTTIIQAQATNLKVTVNPTVGTSGDVASNLDINADEVGTLYFPEGDGTALVGVNAGTGWSAIGGPSPFVVPVGTIDIETGASSTGAIKWDLWYMPLDEGAFAVAA